MAIEYAPLFALETQFQSKDGRNNTGGWLKVFLAATDDPATTYSDYSGTRNPEKIVLDDDGRAVVICDKSKAYRLEVYGIDGALLWTEEPVYCSGTGGGGVSITKVISTDGSISVDENVAGSTTTYDLSLGIDTDDLKPSCLKASASPLTADGQFVFAEIAHEGTLLSVDNGGKVRMEPAWYHFTATVELAYDGTPVNEGRRVTLWSPLSSSVTDFDTSYAHRESIELSGDIHVDAANTEFPLGVTGLGNGIRASLVGFDIHAVTGHGGNNEYRAGEGITIVNSTRTISADFDSVQEKLVAGDNISITGNVISVGNISQEQADWTEEDTESRSYIRNRPDLTVYATKTEVNAGLATKQDVISDLAQIRAGAASGSSAVQPADLANVATTGDYNSLNNRPNLTVYATKAEVNAGLATKQDTISDLSAIRSGAQSGATAVQPADLDTYATDAELASGLATKQDVIDDLSEIRSGAAAGSTAVQPAVLDFYATTQALTTGLAGKEDSSNKSQTIDPSSTTEFPSSAATANFVNSSVATSTANFLGNFTLTDLGLTYPATDAQIGAALDAHVWPAGVTPTNNDYTYIEIQDPQTTGIDDRVERFKFNGTNWAYEYTLNNSSFTAAEKAAIDSGIDSAKVAIYDAHVANSDIHVTLSDKSTWNAKQDAISDLSTIRSGAAAGATAVQDPNYVHTDNNFTSAEKTKLSGIEAGAQVNVKPDWNAVAGSADEILNKPILSTVAITGAFSDLTGTPTIPTVSDNVAKLQYGVATYAQVVAAFNAGKSIYLYNGDTDDGVVSSDITFGDDGAEIIFSHHNAYGAAGSRTEYKVTSSNVWSTTTKSVAVPTVDQSYSSSSANAQSGIAVAQAIAAIPSSSYTAGTGIDITDDVVSVDNTVVAMKSDLPTATSDLTNDSGFITASEAPVQDVQVDGTSVVNAQGIAEITMPTALVPDVTSSDNNKTLVSAYADGVGSYAWAQNTFVAQYGTSTYAEIKAAIDAGYNVLCLKKDSTYPGSSFAGGIGYIYQYGKPGGNIEFNYFQPLPNRFQATEENQGIAIVHSWKVDYRNTWKSSQVVVSPKIVASSPLSLSYSNVNREVTLGVSLGSTLTTSNDAIEVAAPIPDVTSSDDGKILKASYTGGVGSYSWEAESSGTVTDVKVDGVSVVSQGVASITLPTIPSGAQLVPAATSADADKVLTVDSQGTPAWASAQAPISAGDGISISNNVVSAKVDGTTVTVNASGELQASAPVTVDQTYDPTSTNPQSGTAVAEAVAGVDTSLFQAEYGVTPFADIAAAITTKKVVYCKVSKKQNSSRMAFLAFYDLSRNDTDYIQFQYYRSNANADGGDSVFVYDVTRGNVWTTTVRPAYVQSDWSMSSSSAASYIKNKPSIPTKTSDLTNDSGFITLSDVPAQVNADWNSSSGASEILNKPTIPSGTQLVPAATSADADKVLTVNAQGTPEWATGSGSQVQADWTESDSSEPSYIENKPVPKTLTAGTGISITEGQSTITIASTVTARVRDVTVDGASVVSNGVAAITTPTVDQTYDASSTNAQSGVAVASGISAAIAASVMPISVVASLPANPDPNTLYVVTGA